MTRILIDLQACQNESRFRGLGRYAFSMAQEIARMATPGTVHLLLNGRFSATVPAIRRSFDVLPEQNIHVVHLLDRAIDANPAHQWRCQATALLREAYIEMLAPDVVFVPSFFEGFDDDTVLTIGRLSTVPTVVTIHDLIPLALAERYLDPHPGFARPYRAKLEEVTRADGILTISDYSQEEFVRRLGYPDGKVVNASEGCDADFRPLALSAAARSAAMARFGIEKKFVLYTGGADPRKNLDRLIGAFARLPSALQNDHQFVFAGRLSAAERFHLEQCAAQANLPSGTLKFLDFVTDSELIELYNLCEVFAFPSYYEGFGLPCLEAMQCGAPTIGANASSLPEILGNPDAMFDPYSVQSIASCLERVLTDEAFKADLIEKGRTQAKQFSWQASGEKALAKLIATARPAAANTDWATTRARLDAIESGLLSKVQALSSSPGQPAPSDLAEFAQAAAANRIAIENRLRPYQIPAAPNWRIEGPFDSSYSLSLVNRELALALTRQGVKATLLASEGPGDYEADAGFLRANPDVAALHVQSGDRGLADIVSRNMYPPRVTDMTGVLNGLSCYAWEETGYPFSYAEGINEYTQFVTVTSEHVKKVMLDAGVSVPVAVVGNGVDHWTRIEADPSYEIETAGHTFLHVSSCFPRKGADVLLQSYGRAFTRSDDVVLIIKTFRNPHNTIERQLADMQASNPDYPAVTLIMDDLSDSQMKALYDQCDTLVAPSRGEGFGLPMAEAMLSGLHVITTGWGGHLDFCNRDNTSLIDYTFAPAMTHQEGRSISAWAEPDADHLMHLMQEAVAHPRKGDGNALLANWTWDAVARRAKDAVDAVTMDDLTSEPRIGWVTTYRKRCGIATYSEHLVDVLGIPLVILADDPDESPSGDPDNVYRCWHEGRRDDFSRLMQVVDAQRIDTIVIQFNYAFYDLEQLAKLIGRLRDAGKIVVVTLHATSDPQHDPSRKLSAIAGALARCDRLLVHSVKDLNRLKALGLTDNVALFPHGLLTVPIVPATPAANAPVRFASYGFFLPNKGLIELIEAANLLKQQEFNFQLDLVNAAYPAAVSRELIEQARSLVARYELRANVRLTTDFLSDADSLSRLSRAEIVVYPYQATAESASGAVRYGLAAGRAVAVSPLPIFGDVASSVFTLPGTSPADLAEGLKALAHDVRANTPRVAEVMDRAAQWRATHAYPVLGRRLAGMLRGLHRDRRRHARAGQGAVS